jgi:hypothetical protein
MGGCAGRRQRDQQQDGENHDGGCSGPDGHAASYTRAAPREKQSLTGTARALRSPGKICPRYPATWRASVSAPRSHANAAECSRVCAFAARFRTLHFAHPAFCWRNAEMS